MSIRCWFTRFLMIWCELTHWLTHPPNHPPIHLSKGGSVSTNHKSSNRNELSRFDQVLLKFLWSHMFRPTNPPIHQPKKTPIHELGSLHRFQIFKRNWNISICSSPIAFLLIWGYGLPVAPYGSGEEADGLRGIWGHGEMHTCMYTHVCMHNHAC